MVTQPLGDRAAGSDSLPDSEEIQVSAATRTAGSDRARIIRLTPILQEQLRREARVRPRLMVRHPALRMLSRAVPIKTARMVLMSRMVWMVPAALALPVRMQEDSSAVALS